MIDSVWRVACQSWWAKLVQILHLTTCVVQLWGWTKSGICDVRALNRARDCMFLCVGKWFTQWILDFFLASFPTKEHRAETMRIFPCLAGSISWARWAYHFLFSSQLIEKFHRQKQKHTDKKYHDSRKKTRMSSALLHCLKKWTFWKRDIGLILQHLQISAKGNL